MIFTSESGLTDPSRIAEWDEWYRGHLAAMVAVPEITSAQRFRALDEGVPPSLAMYTVASLAVFESDIYLRTRGMGPFVSVVNEALHRRNLFDGLGKAPELPIDGILLLADRAIPRPVAPRLTWLRAIGLDCSIPYRGIAMFSDLSAARRMAEEIGGGALYTAVTERFSPTRKD